MEAILLGLLDERYITLPTTRCIEDKSSLQIFLNSVTGLELFHLIGKNDVYVDSNTLNQIIIDNGYKSSDIFKELGSLTKSPAALKMMSNFTVNCFNLTSALESKQGNAYTKELHSYILECENYLSIKDVDWFEIVLGLNPLDDDFDTAILQEMRDRSILVDTDKIKDGLNKLKGDSNVRDVCKKRLIECGKDAQSFTDMLLGGITWNSYTECFKCSDNKCLVFLDDNYKSFLKQKHSIMTVDKIKILIFMELRLRKMSKYFSVAALRIRDKRHSKVKSLLTKIYNEDVRNGNTTDYSKKQLLMKRDVNYMTSTSNKPVYTGQHGGDIAAIQPLNPLQPLQPLKPLNPLQPLQPLQPDKQDLLQPAQAAEAAPAAVAVADEAAPAAVAVADEAAPAAEAEAAQAAEAAAEAEAEAAEAAQAAEAEAEAAQAAEAEAEAAQAAEAEAAQAQAQAEAALPVPVVSDPTVAEAIPVVEDQIKSADLPQPIVSTDGTVAKSETTITGPPPLEEKAVKFTRMIYFAYNGSVSTDKAKDSISKQAAENMREVCKLTSKERLKVYRVRIGPRTVSIEIGIEDPVGEELSDKEIKDNIVQSIVSGEFSEKMVVIELDSIKDIYFDGISKYDEFKDYPSQHKRILVETDGIYPKDENERIDFEDKLLHGIKEFMEEPELDLNRIQLENVTNIVDKEDRVFVQFVLMNGLYEKKTPHELVIKFKENYSKDDGNNEFTKRYNLTNVVFSEPSIILDKEDVEKMKSMSDEKEEFREVEISSFDNLESDYKRLAYFGCDRTIEDIKNNMITSTTPLSPECEGDINKLIRGF